MKKPALGHIDCPACGTVGGMTVTHDKNGEPYAYCEADCDLQIRIGGKKRRVDKFIARYPWAARAPEAAPPDPVPAPGVSGSASAGALPKAKPARQPGHWLENLGVPS